MEIYFKSSWMILICRLEDTHGRDEVRFTCWVSERHTLPCHETVGVTLGRQKGWVLVSQPPSPQSAWGWAVISSQSGGHGIPDGYPALWDGPIALPSFQGSGFCASKRVITHPKESCCIGEKCAGGRRRKAFPSEMNPRSREEAGAPAGSASKPS